MINVTAQVTLDTRDAEVATETLGTWLRDGYVAGAPVVAATIDQVVPFGDYTRVTVRASIDHSLDAETLVRTRIAQLAGQALYSGAGRWITVTMINVVDVIDTEHAQPRASVPSRPVPAHAPARESFLDRVLRFARR